ncbi:MAG TPA: hypothetical protein VIM28_12025, partial [Solirubrobacterales bacterium]
MQVGKLLGDVADAVGSGQRGQLKGAEDADRFTGAVEEAAAGVARHARGQGDHDVAPAVAFVLDDDALLGAQLGDAAAQLGVPVGVDGRAEVADRAGAGRSAEARHGGVDAAHVGRVDADQGQV